MNISMKTCFDSCNAISLEQTLWINISFWLVHTRPKNSHYLTHSSDRATLEVVEEKWLLETFSIPFDICAVTVNLSPKQQHYFILLYILSFQAARQNDASSLPDSMLPRGLNTAAMNWPVWLI